MDANFKLSEQIAILAALHSASQAASTVTTTWVPVANFHRMAALVDIGAAGSGTVAVAVLQATDNAGTGSKAVTGSMTGTAVATAAPVAGGAAVVELSFKLDDIDANNGYGFVALQVTVAVAAVQLSALLLGHAPRIAPASQYNMAGVTVI